MTKSVAVRKVEGAMEALHVTLVKPGPGLQAFGSERWSLRRVARLLGIGHSTLYRKLKEYEIEVPNRWRLREASREAALARR